MHKEIEVKFLLDELTHSKLLTFLQGKNITSSKKEIQDNYYYKVPDKNDLRIRRTDTDAYLILKKGWMHDEERQEIEVKVAREDFEKLDAIITSLGYEYDTKWHREREEYHFDTFTITIDFNAGYGWVAEIEKVVPLGKEQVAKETILELAKKIGIKPTKPEIFDLMYTYYKKNWKHYYESGETFSLVDIQNER